MDPSTRAVRGTSGLSDWDTYLDHLPKDFPLLPANNEKTAGIDRVKSYLKVRPDTNKPRLYFFRNCVNLIDEMSRYRYKELTSQQQGKQAEKEEPVKVDDHACDALRYLIMSRPEPPKEDKLSWAKVHAGTLGASLIYDIGQFKGRKPSQDPFEGF
jgi:hypothetical protein